MFARQVTFQLKREFVNSPELIETKIMPEILPLLHRQKGFLDELIFVAPGQAEAVAISLWESQDYANQYNRVIYPEIANILEKYIVTPPVVKNFEVGYATLPAFRKFATVKV
jgi:hypothetical protein